MNTVQMTRIEAHGRQLLAIFPNATERDPVKLCKKLRRLEARANKAATDLCNVPNYQEKAEAVFEDVNSAVVLLLGNDGPCVDGHNPNVFINRDPRGYSLKISSEWTRAFAPTLHRDMGGYGIIAPEITGRD